MKRKLIALLLVGAAATAGTFGLAGCNNGGSSDNTGNGGYEEAPEVFTEGLKFTLNEDETRYEVSGIEDENTTEIIIPKKYNGKPVTSIRNSAFNGWSELTSIKIPDSVTSIGISAFKGCSGLTSINIPDSVTSIGWSAFYGCSGIIQTEHGVEYVDKWAIHSDKEITELTLRNNTKGIADNAFISCSGLTSITIPNSVTSIGEYAFNGCSGLTSVTIYSSVTSIGQSAFFSCSSLNSVYYLGDITSWCGIKGVNFFNSGK